jgi:hypothetical protein
MGPGGLRVSRGHRNLRGRQEFSGPRGPELELVELHGLNGFYGFSGCTQVDTGLRGPQNTAVLSSQGGGGRSTVSGVTGILGFSEPPEISVSR